MSYFDGLRLDGFVFLFKKNPYTYVYPAVAKILVLHLRSSQLESLETAVLLRIPETPTLQPHENRRQQSCLGLRLMNKGFKAWGLGLTCWAFRAVGHGEVGVRG